MKYILHGILFLFFSTVCYANNIWVETIRTPQFQTTSIPINNDRYHLEFTYTRGLFREVTLNLDNTLFGRAHKIGNVDITAQIKSAWTQGYSGQDINIGIVDNFHRPVWSLPVVIDRVNTADIRGTYRFIKLKFISHLTDYVYTSQYFFHTPNPPSRTDGNWFDYMTHGSLAKIIAGGKHEDDSGTLMLGIAKDANIFELDLSPSDPTQLDSQYYRNRFDFINLSHISLFPDPGPLRAMTNRYQSMDRSGTYPHGHLPVYIIGGGNLDGVSATYANIARRIPYNSNYYSTEMALSSETFDGRSFSDYLLIVGGVARTGENTFSPAGNMPGEVTELQNRWLVAPYLFQADFFITSNNTIRGTSYAAPYVAGIAAIVNSKFPELSPADVAGILLNTTRDLGTPGTDAVYGRGMVDLANALSPQ
ncbi:MAG: S8 family peptidase [Desulfobacterales bacterium]|nr:S8 family peptidase [Desulfobacterales bacterium]